MLTSCSTEKKSAVGGENIVYTRIRITAGKLKINVSAVKAGY